MCPEKSSLKKEKKSVSLGLRNYLSLGNYYGAPKGKRITEGNYQQGKMVGGGKNPILTGKFPRKRGQDTEWEENGGNPL